MIVRLTGQLTDVSEDTVVLERDGVAYEIMVPGYDLAELAGIRGRAVTLHTIQYFEGNATGGNLTPRLIGFLHDPDRAFFSRFITVKGMGMRKALRALAEPVSRVAAAIENGDETALVRLPGIGKRAAAQLIAELKGKVTDFALGETKDTQGRTIQWRDDQRDALEILVGALHERREDAERWLARAAELHPELETAEAWVKAAYRVRSGSEG